MTERNPAANQVPVSALFRLMADRVPGVVWATDTALRFTESFGAGLAALGLSPSEVVGKTLFEYFQTDDAGFPPIAAHYRALQRESVELETSWQSRTYEVHVQPLFDERNAVIGCVGFAQDITARKQTERQLLQTKDQLEQRVAERTAELTSANADLKRAQEALHYSYEELRAIYDCMVDGLLIADIETKAFTRANRAICQMLGYSSEELLSMSVNDIHPQEELSRVLAAFQLQAEGQITRADSLPVRRKDGSVFCADISSNRIAYRGRPCLIGFFRDVTERRRAEDELRERHDELHAIYAGMADGLLVADIDTKRFVQANRAICQMLGYSEEELLSLSVTDIHPPQNLSRVLEDFQALGERRIATSPECPALRKDGSVIYADVTCAPIVRGQSRYLAGFFHDVTERRRAEEKVRAGLRTQTAISSLLRGALESTTLDAQLERALRLLFSIPWLAVEPKGAIFILDEDTHELVMRCRQGLPEELLIQCGRLPLGKCLCGRAASTRQLIFADRIDAHHETTYPGMLPHGHYCVPIVSGDRMLGVLSLYLGEGHATNADEQAFLSTVADVLAGLIVRDRVEQTLRQRDVELVGAKRIQEQLLPDASPNLPGFDIAGASYPASFTGGDLFDYLALPDESLGIVIGDVSGHGFGPALLMAEIHAYLNALGESRSDIGEILTVANTILPRIMKEDMFITLFFAKLEPRTRSFWYVNAGHPPGYIVDAAGAIKQRLAGTALPLGVVPNTVFAASDRIVLEPGDVVLLLTDGVFEARAPGDVCFGLERALDLLRVHRHKTARDIVDTLCTEARRFSHPLEPADDMTAIVMKVGALSR